LSQVVISIVWLNYNSMKFINVVKDSLKSIYKISIPLELVVVDNASTDGSFEKVSSYLYRLKGRGFRVKTIRLSRNLGYTGGNNIGYLNSDPNAKYIAFINNDLIVHEGSLEYIISYLDMHKDVGIAQGIIYGINNKDVDNAGFMCTETLLNVPIKTPPKKPLYITYASGGYMVVRRELISSLGVPFDWDGFIYFDDMPLGFKAWSMKSRVVSLPVEAGKHVGGASGGVASEKTVYYIYRGFGILTEASNTRFRKQLKSLFIKNLPIENGLKNTRLLNVAMRGFIDGLRIGVEKRKQGYLLDIYSAPLITRYNLLGLLLPNRLLLTYLSSAFHYSQEL